MIFLTVGTHEPFDRLVKAVDHWCGNRSSNETVFGQITNRASYKPKSFEWVANLSPEAYNEAFEDANIVISHVGMGTIITALSLGKPAVLLPRRGNLMETRNDHQYATALRYKEKPGLWIADNETELPSLLNKVVQIASTAEITPNLAPFADPQLLSTIRGFIKASRPYKGLK